MQEPKRLSMSDPSIPDHGLGRVGFGSKKAGIYFWAWTRSDPIVGVRTTQFAIVLSKLPVIIFKMRANTYSSKTVPPTSPHLETSIDVVHLKRHQIMYSQYVDTTCLRSSMHIAFKNTHIAKRTIKINFNHYKSSTLKLHVHSMGGPILKFNGFKP